MQSTTKRLDSKTKIFKSTPFSLTKASVSDEGPGRLTGYASTFGNVDRQGDKILPGSFARTIKERIAAGKVKLMQTHFPYASSVLDVIGTIETAKEDGVGLMIDAAFAETDNAQQVRNLVKGGHVDGLSIGGYPVNASWVVREDNSEGWDITEFALWETTVTAFPANEEAEITTAKALTAVAQGIKTLETMEAAEAREESRRLLSLVGGVDSLKSTIEMLERFSADESPVITRVQRSDIARIKAKIRKAQLEILN